MENIIEKLLTKNIITEKFSKGVLKIKFDIIEAICDVFHYCLMSSAVLLTNIGIEHRGIISCSNVVVNSNGDILVDPTLKEESLSQIKFQVACLVDLEEVVLLINDGGLEYCNKNIHEILPKTKSSDMVVDDNVNARGSSLIDNEKFKQILIYSLQVCKTYHNYLIKQLI